MTLDHDVRRPAAFQSTEDLDLDAFVAICSQMLDPATAPTASSVDGNVPIFEASTMWSAAGDDPRRIMAELNACLLDGPGAFAVRGLVDPSVVDDATAAYRDVIAAERAAGLATGDHFAAPGSNDRL